MKQTYMYWHNCPSCGKKTPHHCPTYNAQCQLCGEHQQASAGDLGSEMDNETFAEWWAVNEQQIHLNIKQQSTLTIPVGQAIGTIATNRKGPEEL